MSSDGEIKQYTNKLVYISLSSDGVHGEINQYTNKPNKPINLSSSHCLVKEFDEMKQYTNKPNKPINLSPYHCLVHGDINR